MFGYLSLIFILIEDVEDLTLISRVLFVLSLNDTHHRSIVVAEVHSLHCR